MTLPLSYSLRNVRARPGRSLMTAGVIVRGLDAAKLDANSVLYKAHLVE